MKSGQQPGGNSNRAQGAYIDNMVASIINVKKSLSRNGRMVVIVNDKLGLYEEIRLRAGLKLEARLERHVNRRNRPPSWRFFRERFNLGEAMIKDDTKQQIRATLSSLLEGFLKKNALSNIGQIHNNAEESGKKGQLKPFHSAILTPATVTVSKYERSFSTTLGSMFEAAAEIIGQQNFAFAKRQFDVTGQIGTAASTTIDSIRNRN